MSKAKSNGRRQLGHFQTQQTPIRVKKMGQDRSMVLLGSRSTTTLLTSSSLVVLLMAGGMPAAWAGSACTTVGGSGFFSNGNAVSGVCVDNDHRSLHPGDGPDHRLRH
jgi:hypothetical protein